MVSSRVLHPETVLLGYYFLKKFSAHIFKELDEVGQVLLIEFVVLKPVLPVSLLRNDSGGREEVFKIEISHWGDWSIDRFHSITSDVRLDQKILP